MLFNMLPVFYKLISFLFNKCIRHFYWLYNLSQIKGIATSKLNFPIIVESKGNISFGVGTSLSKQVKLRLAPGTNLSLGRNCHMAENVDITIANQGSIMLKNKISIGQNTRLYINNKWDIGNNVQIATDCAIFSRERDHYGKLSIDAGTHIGDNTIIDVSDDISIGWEVAIGSNCIIYTHDHDYNDPEKAAWKGGVIKQPVKIEDGAWIGSGVTILPGVTIGKKAVIAAGSVVTISIPAATIWGGIPAKQIKTIE